MASRGCPRCDHLYFVMRLFRVSRSREWLGQPGLTFEVYKIVTGRVRNSVWRVIMVLETRGRDSQAFLNLGLCHHGSWRRVSVCEVVTLGLLGMLQCLLGAFGTSGGWRGGGGVVHRPENWVTQTLTRREGCRWRRIGHRL